MHTLIVLAIWIVVAAFVVWLVSLALGAMGYSDGTIRVVSIVLGVLAVLMVLYSMVGGGGLRLPGF
jgi:hypothetical protein